MILDKLKGVKDRFEEVGRLINEPDVINDMDRYIKLNKEYKELEPIINAYNEYYDVVSNIESAKNILSTEKDEEMREMAKMELDELSSRLPSMEEEIKFLLLPTDPEDEKNAVVEIRAGTGGDEASIFAGDLFRMYTKYCEDKKWKIEVTTLSRRNSGWI